MADAPSPKPANIIMALLDELFIPAWNLRKFIDPIELADLVAYIEKGGWVPRILLFKRAEGGWWVIAGQMRVLAHRKLNKTHIEAEVMDITLDEAKIMAETSNEGKKPYWLDSYENWETLLAENPDWSIRGLADRLGKPKSQIHRADQIMSLLNPASRAMIRESLTSQKSLFFNAGVPDGDIDPENKGNLWKLNSETVRKLIALLTGREKAEAQALAQKTVKIILERRMPGPKVTELVKWIIAGGVPEEFGTAKPTAKANPATPAHTHAHLSPSGDSASPVAVGDIPAAHNHSQSAVSQKVHLFRDWAAGIKVIPQLKHKVGKGETLTFAEAMVLGGYRLGEGIHWLWKEMIKPTLKTFLEKFKKTFGKTIYYISIALVLAFLVWKAWPVIRVALHPIRWIESKFHRDPAESNTPVSTPPLARMGQPVVSNLGSPADSAVVHLKPKPTSVPAPRVDYQPAVSFQPSMEDSKTLELEIEAFRDKTFVKNFHTTPDETMPDDLAAGRVQNLADPDKYTMKIGGGTEKILSISATNTSLTINFKSRDLFSLLGAGGGPVNIIWEDVKAIHVNEIDRPSPNPGTQPDIVYQFGLIVSGAKFPLTFQCSSPEDLEHLVSTIEYFIRHSRLGRDTPLTGIPYPHQGLVLNGDGVVEKLWAGSPMDKAGVALGDHLWSVGKLTSQQQGRNDLERGLQTSAIFYLVTASEWQKAMTAARQPGQSNAFRPKLRRVVLVS